MKLKGISKFEQHVEKYVLAGAAAALTGVVVWQLVAGTKVKVGNEELAYTEMFEPLRKQAQQIKSRVEDPSPKLPDVPKVNLADAFQSQLQGKIMQREQLTALGVPTKLAPAATGGEHEDSLFAVVLAPAPAEIHAHAFWSTIDPMETVAAPDVAAVLPAAQPLDKAAVSVEISFSGVDFKAALDRDPDGDGPIQPVRRAWYRDLEVIGVELQREEEQADGSFANTVIVSSMPGRISGAKIFTDTVKAPADVPAALATIKASGSESIRPSFYETLDGTPTWTEPSMVTDTGEDQAAKDVKTLRSQAADAQKKIDNINKQLKDINAPGVNTNRDGGRGNPGGGGGKGGGGPSSPASSPANDKEKNTRKEKLDRVGKNAAEELDKIRRQLEKLGVDLDGNPLPKAATALKVDPPLLENKALKAWAHDITAVPGETYRYRARVLYNNPYFGQASYLKDEQRALAADPVGRGEWSTWSSDVVVDPQENFFVTGAVADPVKGPRATVEMFKFYYGYPRRAVVAVETGDTLAGTARLPEGLLIYDTKKLEAARSKPAAANPANSPSRDERAPGGGKGGSGLPFVPEAPKDEKKDKEELLGTPIERELAISVNAMMLDAANAVTTGSSERSLAYLQLAGDKIVIRSPEAERLTSLYKRLAAQAKLGEAQGKPKAVAQPKKPKNQEVPPPTRPANNPGGGGGGSGG